ncbi:MAG: hypothetical protein H0W48_02120 [Methylibium sp.]|uniref:hypothetical protein n=1 Tax=Methylibium sp. TaxID=2067992 RepID=UPI0018348998|nr:hypothetical protein [Methylibium sp.]MBA2723925.1 hypothetical protein [Methylibium sp.]MBA3590239.1 hypothetical protein [Methylibium sp.]MBA3623262.1 hypothetical protein [Methylibium sp.]
MPFTPAHLACIAALCLATATPAQADSFASSASSAGSASSGSVSDSIEGSSDSSSDDKEVAEGDYRIIEVTELAERPGMMRLKLQAADDAAREFFLSLPQQTLAQRGLAQGHVVSARHRPYGLEFARADTREAFFLVLADDWHRELESHAVTL